MRFGMVLAAVGLGMEAVAFGVGDVFVASMNMGRIEHPL